MVPKGEYLLSSLYPGVSYGGVRLCGVVIVRGRVVDSPLGRHREVSFMFVLGIMVLGAVSSGGMRQLLFILLVLAILLLLAGAIIAVVALRKQRKDALNMTTLEQLEHEAS